MLFFLLWVLYWRVEMSANPAVAIAALLPLLVAVTILCGSLTDASLPERWEASSTVEKAPVVIIAIICVLVFGTILYTLHKEVG